MRVEVTFHGAGHSADVFISHRPGECKMHSIAVLPSGDFEVLCTHNTLDTNVITNQIKYLLRKRLEEKKNQ